MATRVLLASLCVSVLAIAAQAQTTAFTYQGRLTDNGNPADSFYDFEFRLFDAVEGGTQKGTTLTRTAVEVTNGTFSLQLEFVGCEDCFDGGARFLEISVRPAGGGSYMQLLPRQPLTSTPYAIKALDAARLGGQLATDFIQNTTTQQTMTNFNIAGTGRATIFDAATHISINGLRAFTVNGPITDDGVPPTTIFTASNTFAGDGAGLNTTPSPTFSSFTGKFNSFFGAGAGKANSIGFFNSFFGTEAGFANINGDANAFFGASAGRSNTSGRSNAFFGWSAGRSNTIGEFNSFFGRSAGFSNITGDSNAIFGAEAGEANTEGRFNAIFGARAGWFSQTGSENSFFGTSAGFSNTTGDKNTIIGSFANVGAVDLTNATAIGANAQVSQNNSLILGSINGVNFATADTLVGIGTTAPAARLHVSTLSVNSGENTAVFAAPNIGPNLSHLHFGTTGDWYIRSASSSGKVILQDSGGNVGIGTSAPQQTLHVHGLEVLSTGATGGFKFRDRGSSSSSDDWVWYSDGNVARFFRAGVGDLLTITTTGVVTLNGLGSAGGSQLCRNLSNQISQCSSSLRYKSDVQPFVGGLSLIHRLRPITFTWKDGGSKDIGFAAEEVEKVEPLLVTRNDRGEVEGVKYDRVSVVLINAVNEQQAQFAEIRQKNEFLQMQLGMQNEMIEKQRIELEALRSFICSQKRAAEVCNPRR